MTKSQKKLFKTIKRASQQQAFLKLLVSQQKKLGRYSHWGPAYLKKLKKKKVKVKITLT
ncbi:hypothetical protein [Ruegeria denitrificans]|nr:hypothetical protein [Ruegeria denitrificans]